MTFAKPPTPEETSALVKEFAAKTKPLANKRKRKAAAAPTNAPVAKVKSTARARSPILPHDLQPLAGGCQLLDFSPLGTAGLLSAGAIAHQRLSTTSSSWHPNHMHAGCSSPFLGHAYRYLRAIPFGPINYKLTTVCTLNKDQQFVRDWISWNAHQAQLECGPQGALEQDSDELFWQRVRAAGQHPFSVLHFKDMEQWYHSPWNATNDALKTKDKTVQRVENPWRKAEIESFVDRHGLTTRLLGLPAVEAQFKALGVLPEAAGAPALDMATAALLRLAWKHRHCDRTSLKVCAASALGEHLYWIPDCTVFHPANLNYLCAHPNNLMTVLPQYCRYTWVNPNQKGATDQLDVYDFSGLASSSWYAKGRDDFFYLHIEQLSMSFANFCHEGAMRWWFIPFDQLHLIARVVLRCICSQHICSAEESVTILARIELLNDAAKAASVLNLMKMLIIGKRCLPPIADLLALGVTVQEVTQHAGQMLVGDGIVFHQGRSLTPSNVHEAINFIPESWLLRGLPELLQTLETFEQFPAAYLEVAADAEWNWITKHQSKDSFLLAHVIVPMEWSFCFLSLLRNDIANFLEDPASSRFNYTILSVGSSQTQKVVDQLDTCIAKLCSSEKLYEFYKLAWPTDITLNRGNMLKLGSIQIVSN